MRRLTMTANESEPIRYARSAAASGRMGVIVWGIAGAVRWRSRGHSAPRPASQGAVHRPGGEQLGQQARLDPDQEPAPAAVDADAIELEDARLHVHRQRLPRREWRGAADLVAAGALGGLGRAGPYLLAADGACQVLGAHL